MIFHQNRERQRLANRSRTASRSCVEAAIDEHGEHASYPTKTNVPAMFAKKQTRQSNAKSRRNQHRKHSGKTTCAKHVDATVSPTISVPENHENVAFCTQMGSFWVQIGRHGSFLPPSWPSRVDLGSIGPTRIDPGRSQGRSWVAPRSILGRYGARRLAHTPVPFG